MRSFGWLYALACAGLLVTGCDQSQSPPAPRVTPGGHLDQAQPKLRTMKLYLGAHELVTELCTNEVQRMTGMMFRTNLAENEAMLFVFPYAHQTGFFMKNTIVPLSAAYIDAKGVILEIHDLQPRNLESVMAETDKVQYVLETTQGWFKRHNLTAGAVIRTDAGTLEQTFFGRR
jgi:uncharacterized membrane protein (UPF0127 family)